MAGKGILHSRGKTREIAQSILSLACCGNALGLPMASISLECEVLGQVLPRPFSFGYFDTLPDLRGEPSIGSQSWFASSLHFSLSGAQFPLTLEHLWKSSALASLA